MRTEARRPTFRQLEAFHAVMAAGSMKAAAATLFVSQAAVSKLIASLEEDLGLALFDTKRGGLRPSEAGLVVHRQTEQLFGAVWKIAELADKLRTRQAGRLRIAAMSTLSVHYLPQLLAGVLAGRDAVQVELDTFSSNEIVGLVRDRRYDLGLAMPPVDLDGVELMKAYRLRCSCICSKPGAPGSVEPMARKRRLRSVTPQTLRDHEFVSLAEGSLTRMRIDELFTSLNIKRRMTLSARSPATVATFVLNGRGVSIVDPFTASEHRGRGGAVYEFEPAIPSTILWIKAIGAQLPGVVGELQAAFEQAVQPWLMQDAEAEAPQEKMAPAHAPRRRRTTPR